MLEQKLCKNQLKAQLSRSKKRKYLVTERKVRKWFRKINKIFFENTLPEYSKIVIQDDVCNWGLCKLSRKNADKHFTLKICENFPSFEMFISILTHEMVHMYQGLVFGKMSHAKTFLEWECVFKKYGIEICEYDEID